MESQLVIATLILATGLSVSAAYPHRKRVINYLRSYLLSALAKLQGHLTHKNQDSGSNKIGTYESYFQSLAPTNDADENGKYSTALRWAIIEQESVRNIAVTGPFGAGKTSVLKTFEKRNQDIEFLNISLASFSEDISPKEPKESVWRTTKARDDEKRQREYLIEKSILQQIIYKETKKVLPMSRFERLSKVSGWSRGVKVIASVLLILLLLLFLKLDSKTFLSAITAFPDLSYSSQLIIIVIASTLIFNSAQLLREAFKNKSVNKVNLLKGDIELSEKTGASILNLHIDEIIYFFEETNYEVVVFEDLDRFDGIEIFTKLREINTLLNQSKQLGNKKIVFIYAVKDDIFDEVSRTKFFDFIVPIIPIVNSSNSRDILLNMLRESPYGADISDRFVSDLTLYINDMRLILNIFNEYIIYSENLMNQINLVPQRLLAFIVYKNKYPNDFSLLNKGKGIVAEAFENKNRIILELSTEIDEDIEKLEKEISDTKARFRNEVAKNSKELRSLYLFKYGEKLPALTHIRIGNQNISLSNLLDESTFNELIEDKGDVATYQNSHRQGRPPFEDIQNEVDPEYSYAERLELLKRNDDDSLEILYTYLDTLKDKKTNIKGRPLSFILKNYPNKKADLLGKHSEDKLLSYLLTNNWIDEGYNNYLSYFHPGSRSPQDVNFLLAVNEPKKLPITYKITAPEEILSQLSPHELGSQYAMNLDLLEYMYSVDSPRLMDFLTNFHKFREGDFEFVFAFINYSKHSEKFIGDLADKWYSLLYEIIDKSNIADSKKFILIKLVFQSSSLGTILNQNRDSVIGDFISSSEQTYKLLLAVETSKCIAVLKKLKVKFTKLAPLTQSPELFEFIVDNYYYSLNHENIKSIFDYYELKYEDEYPRFSDIRIVGNPDINGYVRKNLNSYVTHVLLGARKTLVESESSIKTLLNSTELSIENKAKVIQKLNFALKVINDVSSDIESLWPLLLKFKKLEVSWQNVFEASFHDEIESIHDELWRYLAYDEVSELLSKESIPEIYQSDAPDFFEKLIRAESTRPETLKKIIHEFSLQIDSLSDYELSPEVTSVLVNAGNVSFTDENIEFLRNYSIRDVEALVAINIDEFSAEASHIYQVLPAELERLLTHNDLPHEVKLAIISKYQDRFHGESELLDSAWSVIKDARSPIFLNDELVIELSKQLTSMSDKCLLLATQVRVRDWDSLSNLLSATGIKPLQQIASRRRFINLHNTIGEAKFIDTLLANSHISSYSYEGEGDEKIKINSKRK